MFNVYVMGDHILAPKRYPENFVLISLLEVCQEWGEGGQEQGLHEGRLGFLMVNPNNHILNVLCHYLYCWLRYKDLLLW